MSCHVSGQSLRLFFCRPCTLAVGPIPPDVEKTRGEKDPCSTSLTR